MIFINDIKGRNQEGFHPKVADSISGDNNYSSLCKVNLVECNNDTKNMRTDVRNRYSHALKNKYLTIKPTDIIVNCLFIQWKEDPLKVIDNKTLNFIMVEGKLLR